MSDGVLKRNAIKPPKIEPPHNFSKGPLKDGDEWQYKYNFRSKFFFSELELELQLFKRAWSREQGGLGRYGHFRRAVEMLWPKLVWNPWLERQVQSLCDNQWVAWAGCAAAGKTFGALLFAMVWWVCDPLNTTVILTSTTGKMIRKRAWSVVRYLYYGCSGFPGNLVDSKTTLQAQKGDDKNAIFAQAVAEGETDKAVANIQGVHNRRIMVIIDEATDTPQAAFDACANLYAGCQEFICLVLGNPSMKLDQMGRFAEPADGWLSVNVEDEEWETKTQLNGKRGVVVRFDCYKSPNVLAGKTLYPYLVKKEEIEGAENKLGESSPLFWKFWRGFWAPDGVLKTVLSETLVLKMNGMGQFIFSGTRHFRIAGCDPAFGGGDRAILRFGECGDSEGKYVIQLTEEHPLRLDAQSNTPIHFQLAEQIQKKCQDNGIDPDHFGIDATGEGGGLADILSRNWSPRIIRVEFGGNASDDPVSSEDRRPCSEVYERQVAQLWFQVREYLIAGQLKGLDATSVREFCNRLYDDRKRKIFIQSKLEMKKTFGNSPDHADAVAVVVEVARRKGIIVTPKLGVARADDSWLAFVKRQDTVHENMYLTVAED